VSELFSGPLPLFPANRDIFWGKQTRPTPDSATKPYSYGFLLTASHGITLYKVAEQGINSERPG